MHTTTEVAQASRSVSPVGRFAAGLLTGNIPSSPDRPAAAVLSSWLRRNGYPLLALRRSAPSLLADDAELRAEVEWERERYVAARSAYADLRTAWLDREIECVVLKAAGHTPSFPYAEPDLDILVRPEDASTARATLRALGYVGWPNNADLAGQHFWHPREGRALSGIHLYDSLPGTLGLVDQSALWGRRRRSADDPLVFEPEPVDALLVAVAEVCFGRHQLRFADLACIRYRLSDPPGQLDWDELERRAAQRGWLDGLAFTLLVFSDAEQALCGDTVVPFGRLAWFERILSGDAAAQARLTALRAIARLDLPLDLGFWFSRLLLCRQALGDPQRPVGERWRDAGRAIVRALLDLERHTWRSLNAQLAHLPG